MKSEGTFSIVLELCIQAHIYPRCSPQREYTKTSVH